MDEKQTSRQNKNNFHLAGIIPVSGQPLDFKMPWDDHLMPVSKNYLAVERSIYECAMAGCETIWIIANKDTMPLMRHRIGDWVLDPIINIRTLKEAKNPKDRFKQIPIYYVPISPKDKEIRMSIAHSILFAYKKISFICGAFSRWSTPGKFYVSFPYGVYSVKALHDHRHRFSSKESVFLQSPDGKTAKDGEYLAFTFDTNDYRLYRDTFRSIEDKLWKGYWDPEANNMVKIRLPYDEQYTGRFITIVDILEPAIITPENSIVLPWYNNISSWANYKGYLSSKNSRTVRRPNSFLKYREFSKIGEDVAEELKDEDILDFDE